MPRKLKEETVTFKVEELLRARDDFMSPRDLRAALNEPANRINAALFELRKYRVIDVVVEPDGTGWWFALPANLDQRQYRVCERTPESSPRKQRRKQK